MVDEIRYTSIKRVLDNLLDHPMLGGVTLEQAVRHTLRFISLHGYPALYKDRTATVDIHDYRGVLPCDLVYIVQVMDPRLGTAMRAMTGTFPPGTRAYDGHIGHPHGWPDHLHNVRQKDKEGCPVPPLPLLPPHSEPAFKTQGGIIYVTFPEGQVDIAYKSIPVDDDGCPLLIDNETYLGALDAYIKVKVFTVKFDMGKISAAVLQNAQQEYAWAAHSLRQEFRTPSLSEMESIARMWNTMLPDRRQFDRGFARLGDREYLVNHRGAGR